MEEGKRSRTSFQKGWPLLKKGVNKFIDLIEGGVEIDNSSFTVQDYMSIYTYPLLQISPNQIQTLETLEFLRYES